MEHAVVMLTSFWNVIKRFNLWFHFCAIECYVWQNSIYVGLRCVYANRFSLRIFKFFKIVRLDLQDVVWRLWFTVSHIVFNVYDLFLTPNILKHLSILVTLIRHDIFWIIKPPESIILVQFICILCGVFIWWLLRLWKIRTHLVLLLVLISNGCSNRCGSLVVSAGFEAILRHVYVILIEFRTRLSGTDAVMRIVFVQIHIS